MFGPHSRQRHSEPAKRSARRWIVLHKLYFWRSPNRISSRRNEKFRGFQFPQQIELNLPERFAAKQQCCFVLAHPARFAAGEQHRADVHAIASGMRAVECNSPSVKILARKPPRPFRNASAPDAMARSIQ